VNRPDDRAALLGRLVAALSKPEGDLRVALERASVTEAGIAPTMARRVWDLTLARYSPEALAGLCSQADAGLRVGVVLGVSVAVAPLRALVLPLLSGASVGLRPSRRQPTVAMLLREAMAAEGLPVWAWSGVGGEPVDRVVAYGRDETLDAMAAALPSGVEFVGYGHGYGVAVVAADDAHDAAAEAVALDVALHDQRGCLSPQAVLVEGDAEGFAGRVQRALDALAEALPKGAEGAAEGAAGMQWAGVEAALGATVSRGAGGVVAARGEGPLRGSPGGRVVLVRGVEGMDAARALLGPHAAFLSTVGASAGARGWAPSGYRGRTVALGTMQDPPLDGPEDVRGLRPR
jgi:hypothetical protein